VDDFSKSAKSFGNDCATNPRGDASRGQRGRGLIPPQCPRRPHLPQCHHHSNHHCMISSPRFRPLVPRLLLCPSPPEPRWGHQRDTMSPFLPMASEAPSNAGAPANVCRRPPLLTRHWQRKVGLLRPPVTFQNHLSHIPRVDVNLELQFLAVYLIEVLLVPGVLYQAVPSLSLHPSDGSNLSA